MLADHVRHDDRPARRAPPPQPLLRGDAAAQPQGLHRVQPHALPDQLRRLRGRVLAPAEPRDALGRLRRAQRGGDGPGRLPLRPAAHLPRPQQVRGRPGQVRADHGARRRDPQRPGHAAPRREHVLVRARGQRRAAVRAGPRGARRTGRAALGGRGVPAPDPGPEVEGRRAGPVRRRHPRPRLLPVPPPRPGRHPDHHHAHRLDVGGRLRDLPARRLTRNETCGTGSWRPASRTRSGRPARRHPPDRGRHLQLGRRHELREQPLRARPRPARRPGQRRGLRRTGGTRANSRRGREAEDRRRRDRRRPAGDERDGLAGLGQRRERTGDLGRLSRHGSRRTSGSRGSPSSTPSSGRTSRSRRPTARGTATIAPLPFWDPEKQIPKS